MTGDTQHVYAIKDSDTDPKQQQKEGGFEHFSEKDPGKLNSTNSSGPESCKTVLNSDSLNSSHLPRKNKDNYNQREAVIRPQQAGRIDFKSFQSKPKFSNEQTWSSSNSSSCKSSPQSPTGKSKGKEKNKRYGKGPHLYKLNINSRSNPTIGIAYPQQKITSAKKLDGNRELVKGSYRFNVPSVPEREAELQQEDLIYSRRFQEDSSNRTSTSYTSHTTAVTSQNQRSKAHSQVNVNVSRDNTSFNGQMQYPEFHGNRNNSNISPFSVDWHSSDKTFAGGNYGMPPQKQSTFPVAAESSKSNVQGFRPVPFPYSLSQLHEVAADPFNNEHSSQCHFQQDYLDAALPNTQVAHSGFVFQLSADGHEESFNNGQYSTSSDGRSYTQPSHQTQFLRPSNQGITHRVSHYKGRADHPSDMNGAISSTGAISTTGAIASVSAIEQNQSTFQENQTVCTSDTFNLHNNGVAYISMNKKCSSLKDDRGTERMDTQGKSLRMSITQSSLPQMHFQDKVYNGSPNSNVPDGLVPFDKNIPNKIHSQPRIPQGWEGNRMFPTKDHSSAPYSLSVTSQFSLPCQSVTSLTHAEQKQHVPRNGASRLPWQQIHLASAMPNQNRIELSRQLTNQQLAFPLATSEWPGCKKTQKSEPVGNPAPFQNKHPVNNEELQNSRSNGNCNTATAFAFQSGLDNSSSSLCDSRNASAFCDLNPIVSESTRSSNHRTLPMSKVSNMPGSPYQSPPSSPADNTRSTSTCSTLSPVSTVYSANSPLNSNSEESHMSTVTTASNFYHRHCHTKEGKIFSSSEQINSNLLHHHHDPIRAFTYSSADHSRGTKDSLLYIQDNSFLQQNPKINGCTNNFDTESQSFSEQQFFANSLSSANLDQLDVLLTCKQCDQNFSNVASFLDHRQYCGLHSASHTEMHDPTRATEARRLHAESTKGNSTRSGADPHQSLVCLSKPCDLLLDGENAVDPKDDPFKLNIFGVTGSSSVLLTASDLEIDDAKLDSLINETLNGLDYQSDNAEIDSSFIEAFADDELSAVKVAGSGEAFKMKDCMPLESKVVTNLTETEDKQAVQMKTVYNNGNNDRHLHKKERSMQHNRKSEKKDSTTAILSKSYSRRMDKFSIKNFSHESSFDSLKYSKPSAKLMKLKEGRKLDTDIALHRRINEVLSQPAQSSRKKSEREKHKRNSDIRDPIHSTPLKIVSVNSNSKLHRPALRDIKKRKSSNRTWSKELIHKIVQQKNKLHKLHVKSNKNLQVSLVSEQLLPRQHSSKLGEYDYVSDSDQETEPRSSKYLTPCLNQLAKYSITRGHKSKCGRVEAEESWRYIKIKKTPKHSIETEGRHRAKRYSSSRFRRRSSRSSTSSEYSNITSSSSENANSPISTERTDSDNEKGKNTFVAECIGRDKMIGKSARTAKDNSINRTDFSRTMEEPGSAKCLFSGRVSQSSSQTMMHLNYNIESQNMHMDDRCQVRSNPSHVELSYSEKRLQISESFKKDVATTINDPIAQNNELAFDRKVTENFSSCEDSIAEYSTASVSQNNSPHTTELTTDTKDELTDVSNKMKDSLVGSTFAYKPNAGCFHDNSAAFNIQAYDDTAQSNMNQNYSGHKDLGNHHSDIFSEPLPSDSSHLEDNFFCQNESSCNYLQKNHVKRFINAYSREKCQGKIKSPVSFHTSGIYEDISIPSFNGQLYTDTLDNKDYYAFSCNGDKEGNGATFHLQYPPFLEQKEWDLLSDMTTILPEEISHFEDLSIQQMQVKKFAHAPGPSPVATPPLLPEKLSEQNGSFAAPLSDDDLEIKRLVTELENQLQAPRRNNETTVAQVSAGEYLNVNLKSPPTSLPLEQDEGDRKNAHTSNHLNNRNTDIHTSAYRKGTVLKSPEVEHPSTDGNIEGIKEMWTCPFPLVSLDAEPDFQTPEKLCENPSSPPKDNQSHYQRHLNGSEKRNDNEQEHNNQGESDIFSESYSEKAEEKLENQYYTENLMANLAIMSGTVLGKSSSQQSSDKQQGGRTLNKSTDHEKSVNLSPQYGSPVAEKQSKYESDAVLFTFENTKPSSCVTTIACNAENKFSFVPADHTQEKRMNLQQPSISDNQSSRKSEISDFLSESEEADQSLIIKSQIISSARSPETKYNDRTNDNISPSYVGMSSIEQHSSENNTTQDSTTNPLQQLQLFVARTAQCNEELMTTPCYPVPTILSGHSSSCNINSEQNEEIFNSSQKVETAINPVDTSSLQDTCKNKCQVMDTDASPQGQDILIRWPEDTAEIVTENSKADSSPGEHEKVCNGNAKKEHTEISDQNATSQIPLSNNLKKTAQSKDGVISNSEFTENQCSLSLNGINENPSKFEGKDFSEITDKSQNSTQSSVSVVFNERGEAGEIISGGFSSDINQQTEKESKQCLDVLKETLKHDKSKSPLSRSFSEESNCNENPLVKHLTTDGTAQCKALLGITDPMQKQNFQICTNEKLPAIEENVDSSRNDHMPGDCSFTPSSEIGTKCSCKEGIPGQLPVTIQGSYSNITPVHIDKCKQQEPPNSSKGDFIPINDECKESSVVHLPFNVQNAKKKSLGSKTQENATEHDFEYTVAEKQMYNGQTALKSISIGKSFPDILLSKRREELSTSGNVAKNSNENTDDQRPFLGKDTNINNRPFKQTASLLTNIPIYLETISNPCTISEMSHTLCSASLEMNKFCNPSNNSGDFVENEEHSKCDYAKLCSNYNEKVLPSLQRQLVELPSSSQNISDLNLHRSPLGDSIPMDTLNQYSNTDNCNSSAKGKSNTESNAHLDFLTEKDKPKENSQVCIQDGRFPTGIKQMESNLFSDNSERLFNAETLTKDNELYSLTVQQQENEAIEIANIHKQINECSDDKTVNQLPEVSEEVQGESEFCGNPDFFHLNEDRSQPIMDISEQNENGEKDGMNKDDIVQSSLTMVKTFNNLHGSEHLDLMANNLFPENISKIDSQNSVELTSSQKEHNPQIVIMCNVCSASFRSKQGLVRHKAIKHHLKGDKTSQSKENGIQEYHIPTTEPNTVWKDNTKNNLFCASENKTYIEDNSLDNPVNKETIQSDQHHFLYEDQHIDGNSSTFKQNEIEFQCNENQHFQGAIDTNKVHYGSTKEEPKSCVITSNKDIGTMSCNGLFDAKEPVQIKISKSQKIFEYSRDESGKPMPYLIDTKDIARQYKKQNNNMPNPTGEKSRNIGKDESELIFNGAVVQSSKQVSVNYREKEDESCALLQLQVMAESRDSTLCQEQTENTLSTSKTIKMCITSKEWTSRQQISNNETIIVEEKACNLINVLLKEEQYKNEWNGELESQTDFTRTCSSDESNQNMKHIKIEQETSEKAVELLQGSTECQHSDPVIPAVFNSSMPNLISYSPLKVAEIGTQTLIGQRNGENAFEKLQDLTPLKSWDETYPVDLELPVLDVIPPNAESQHPSSMNNAMSQIFSEENSVVRKKCPRVYGNRSKKCKVDTELSSFKIFSADFMMEDSEQILSSYRDHFHHKRRTEHYDTISIDDTIMLHTSNDSKTVANRSISTADKLKCRDVAHECSSEDGLAGTGMSEHTNNNLMGLLSQNFKLETLSDAVLNSTIWSSPPEVVDISAHGNITSFESTSENVTSTQNQISNIQSEQEATESLSSQLLEPFDGLASDHCILRSINVSDLQALNQSYELPDGDLYNSPGNKSSILNAVNGMSEESSQNLKLSKIRTDEGKMAKNRGDINVKSKDKQYKCKVCFQWFLTLGELDFHKLSHNPSPPPTCYMCVQRKFSSREQLRDHLKEKHAKNKAGIWTCGMCLKEISDVWMYNEHLREHATQFARKGQAQKSVIGLTTCFGEDSAMKNFFNTLLSKKHGKSKTVDSVAKSLLKETKVLKENLKQSGKTKDQGETSIKNKLNFTSALKLSASLNPDVTQKTETIQKNVAIHPDCKDPSRDCHHCGKQFPKPFKLQRHLVVHSLQKIYLCYKCPIFYLEMQELRAHLKGEHRVLEEPEVKHTTLYTCELCADVMHVIKKSFICSTCNYTFSKKEQYDRHMEKHLAGGNKTHKFRGVMRPYVPLQNRTLDPEASLAQSYSSLPLPPNKKQKTNHNELTVNTENNIPTISSIHFEHNVCESSLEGPPDFLPDEIHNTMEKVAILTPTSTDIVGDFSELLVELEQSPPNIASSPPCLSPIVCHPLSNDLHLVDLSVPPMPDAHNQLYDVTSPVNSVNTYAFQPHDRVEQCNLSATEKMNQDESCESSKQTNDFHKIPCNSHTKTAAVEKMKQNSSEIKSSEKPAKDSEPKTSQKKRKEQRSMCVRYSNGCKLTVDEGNKKRKQVKSDHVKNSCIPQDHQGTATTRDESAGSHLASRTKQWANSSQSKRNGMNFCPLKQPEMRSFFGEFKHKKELISKPPLYSKGGAQSVNNSVRKHRLMQSIKPIESNNYRTAESQSNLLSQLFGQKLTSFKIPLRKDTSE
ncbi:uncharacterized protein znf469 [Hemitrygon akajei]|uniref:uncharacterized protein znf469 n=1 Tax=Hemitrygon akajei TaxID=2704970 RepID=UPI003BF9F352